MIKAVVIGGTHHNTLSMIRSLGMKGVKVDVILEDKHAKDSYVSSSIYIKDCHNVENGEDAMDILRTKYPTDQTVVVCSDDVASRLDSNTARFMDKQVQVELAWKVGFDVPQSKVYVIGKGIPDVPCYPCIVKPLESIHGGKRFSVCCDRCELEKVFNEYEANDVVQIQEYIQKDEEIVVDGVSVNGDIIIPGYVLKHRDYLGGTSFSTTYPIGKLSEEICTKIRAMIAEIGYEGLFGVELIRSKEKYYFVEVNLRNDATTYSLAVAGVNLPYIWVLGQQGMDYTIETKGRIKEINSIVEFRDLPFALKGKISLWQWWRDYQSCECKYFYDKNDLKPYRIARNQFFGSLFGKVLKRLQ